MITRKNAETLVCNIINQPDPNWPDKPKMVITQVEKREEGWLIYWTSSTWLKTKNVADALAGNGPYWVTENGEIQSVGTVFIEERIIQIQDEIKLRQAQQIGDSDIR